jgi:hypothetical protein
VSRELVDLVWRGGPDGGPVRIPKETHQKYGVGRHVVLAVLHNMAEHANPAGIAWPSRELLALESYTHRRSVEKAQMVLAELGLIEANEHEGRRGIATRWKVLPGIPLAADPRQVTSSPVAVEPQQPVAAEVAAEVAVEVATGPRHEPEPEPEPEEREPASDRDRARSLLVASQSNRAHLVDEVVTVVAEHPAHSATVESWITAGRRFTWPSAIREALKLQPESTSTPAPRVAKCDKCDDRGFLADTATDDGKDYVVPCPCRQPASATPEPTPAVHTATSAKPTTAAPGPLDETARAQAAIRERHMAELAAAKTEPPAPPETRRAATAAARQALHGKASA